MHYSIEKNGRYWQCGMWVHHIKDATKYPTEDQAEAVSAMRELNGRVVPNNTEWRDLSAPTKDESYGVL